ncbi:hypothetical protein WN943_003198 [Citrus x changshan-huyou]
MENDQAQTPTPTPTAAPNPHGCAHPHVVATITSVQVRLTMLDEKWRFAFTTAESHEQEVGKLRSCFTLFMTTSAILSYYLKAGLDVIKAENNYLRLFQQEVEQQLQLQDALNLLRQEEIRNPRQLTAVEPHRVSVNLVESEPSTSQSRRATDDHDKLEPKETEVK